MSGARCRSPLAKRLLGNHAFLLRGTWHFPSTMDGYVASILAVHQHRVDRQDRCATVAPTVSQSTVEPDQVRTTVDLTLW
jgi:hypothetical protein